MMQATPIVNPTGAGLVVAQVGPNTANLKNITTRAFVKNVGNGMINNANSATGKFPVDVDLYNALNMGKYAIRRVILSTIYQGDSVSSSTIAQACNISLAPVATDMLYDELNHTVISPAAPSYHNGVTPSGDEMTSYIRKYDSELRTALVKITETFVEKIKEAQAQLNNETPMLFNLGGLPDSPMDQKRELAAREIIDVLHQSVAAQFTNAKIKTMLGIEDSLYNGVRRYAVDTALLTVAEAFADSFVQAGMTGDVTKNLREYNTYNAFMNAYCNQYVNHMFSLTKNPDEFVEWLSKISRKFSRNLTTTKTVDPGIQVSTVDQGDTPISNILIASETVIDKLPGVKTGRRKGIKPIGYYNSESFYTKNGKTFLYSQEDKKQVESGEFAKRKDLVELLNTNNVNLDGTIANLTPLAERIFNLNEDVEEKDLAVIDNQRLYDVPINDKCQYIDGRNGSIVLNTRAENRIGPYSDPAPDTSFSGKNMNNLVMSASMGDIDYNDDELYSWYDKIMSDKVTPSAAVNKFGLVPILVKTDTISEREVLFTPEHMAMALTNPALWHYPVNQLEKLNSFITESTRSLPSDLKDLSNMMMRTVQKFKNRPANLVEYYQTRSNLLAQELSFTELSPFHEYKWGANKIAADPRGHVGSFPASLVDPIKEGSRFANIVIDSKATLKKLTDALADFDTKKVIETANAASTPGDDLFIILQNFQKRIFSRADDVTKVTETEKEILETMVIAPALKDSKSYKHRGPTAKKSFVDYDAGSTVDERANKVIGGVNFSKAHHYNLAMLSDDVTITPVKKMIIALGMLRKLSPYAVAVNAQSRLPLGLSMDIVKVEKQYCNSVYIATPNAIDAIVTPKPTKKQELGNGNLNFRMPTRIQVVNNMAGGSSIVVPNAVPSVRIDHTATDFGNNPMMCLDFITMSRYNKPGLAGWCVDLKNNGGYEDRDIEMIKLLYKDAETQRVKTVNTMAGPAKTESYSLFLRPARDLMRARDLMPYMGTPRYRAVVGKYSTMPAVNFYTTEIVTNPWIARLGACYNQFYVNSRQIIRNTSNGHSITMNTMCIDPAARNLSETTTLLLNAFDFETFASADLTPFQENVVGELINTRGGAAMTHNRDFIKRVVPAAQDDYLSKAHPLARMGVAVPATFYTSEKMKIEARKQEVPIISTYNGFCVLSPVSG